MTVQLTIQKRAKVLDGNAKSTSIAGVVYGPKFPSTPVMVDRKEFEKIYKEAGESTLLSLAGLDSDIDVLIKEIEFSPLKGQVTHVDFYVIEKGKEVTAHVPLHFINEAPAIKEGAVIDKVMHEVTVTSKPEALPAHIDIDLTLLQVAGDKIHISDISLPKGVVLKHEPVEVVAVAEHGRVEKIEEEIISAPEEKIEEEKTE